MKAEAKTGPKLSLIIGMQGQVMTEKEYALFQLLKEKFDLSSIFFPRNMAETKQLKNLIECLKYEGFKSFYTDIEPAALIKADGSTLYNIINRFRQIDCNPEQVANREWHKEYSVEGSNLKIGQTYKNNSFDAIKMTGEIYDKIGKILNEFGIIGLSLVLDRMLTNDPKDDALGKHQRSFGHDTDKIKFFGKLASDALNSVGAKYVLKHFPGLGCIEGSIDTHQNCAFSSKTLESLIKDDMAPFVEVINHNRSEGIISPEIMLAHVLCEKIDPNWVTSLSLEFIKQSIKAFGKGNSITFITDDLANMKGANCTGINKLKEFIAKNEAVTKFVQENNISQKNENENKAGDYDVTSDPNKSTIEGFYKYLAILFRAKQINDAIGEDAKFVPIFVTPTVEEKKCDEFNEFGFALLCYNNINDFSFIGDIPYQGI